MSQANTQNAGGAGGGGCLGCLGVISLVMVVGFIGKAFEASPVLGSVLVGVIVLAVVFTVVGKISAAQDEKRAAAEARAAGIRADIESRATVDAIGGCMWCGHAGAHRAQNGHAVHPRDWHALDVEEAIRVAVGGPGHPAPTPVPPAQPQEVRGDVGSSPYSPAFATGNIDHRYRERSEPDARLLEQLSYDESGECQWCGAPVPHRNDTGRIVHPARYHRAEYEAERDAGGAAGR
ncbi:hypothetical protein FRP1_11570 [Pseudonocardia sp. EC080625-04]|nr:hypothetical protein FRP1_11570 [Pseudonocardia sp. EC080625-04]